MLLLEAPSATTSPIRSTCVAVNNRWGTCNMASGCHKLQACMLRELFGNTVIVGQLVAALLLTVAGNEECVKYVKL